MPKHSLCLIFILALTSCHRGFLEEEQIQQLNFSDTDSHIYVYYTQDYEITDSGDLYKTAHSMLRIGKSIKSLPRAFYVNDASVETLEEFYAKIRHSDGSEVTFGAGDLMTFSLSDESLISEQKLKILPFSDRLGPGDLLEMITKHQVRLPALGIRFDLSDLGQAADNVTCRIKIPKGDTLLYEVFNDTLHPRSEDTESGKTRTFTWAKYRTRKTGGIFAQKNVNPVILATVPRFENDGEIRPGIKNRVDFGDWFQSAAESRLVADPVIDSLARRLTGNLTDAKAKMDAIFQYCQKNIRYEQVYLEYGEYIPNEAAVILSRRYGDCKDYATIMISMARCAGLHPDYALCYRGRGNRFYDDMPVNQFNHCIVCFPYNGKIYWYDGTNRTGPPGLTTTDLTGQPALIVEKGKSRLVAISESNADLMTISGRMKLKDKSLSGNLEIRLEEQYAIEFFFYQNYLNKSRMKDLIIQWIHREIDRISCHSQWRGKVIQVPSPYCLIVNCRRRL